MRAVPALLALVVAALLLTACGSGETATSASTPSQASTERTAAATPSRTPAPSPTATPTPSPTPSPTVSPAPIPIHHPPPYTVAIEAGHGGPDYWGASARDSDGNLWIEKDLALDVAERVQLRLLEAGYNAVMVRNGDSTLTAFDPWNYRPSLIAEAQARVDLANVVLADALVSIHFNGWVDGSQKGTETYCNPDRSFGQESCALALFVQDALVRRIREAAYDVSDRGVRNDADVSGDPENQHSFMLGANANFRPSLMPGVIAELLFLSNPDDLAFIRREDGLDIIADALAEGIDAYFAWLNPPR